MIDTYPLAEVAERIGVSPRWLRTFVREQELAYIRGSRNQIRLTDVQAEAVVEAMTTNAPRATTQQPAGIAAAGRRRRRSA